MYSMQCAAWECVGIAFEAQHGHLALPHHSATQLLHIIALALSSPPQGMLIPSLSLLEPLLLLCR